MYCSKCGNEIKNKSDLFCSNCGNKISESLEENEINYDKKQTNDLNEINTNKNLELNSSSELKSVIDDKDSDKWDYDLINNRKNNNKCCYCGRKTKGLYCCNEHKLLFEKGSYLKDDLPDYKSTNILIIGILFLLIWDIYIIHKVMTIGNFNFASGITTFLITFSLFFFIYKFIVNYKFNENLKLNDDKFSLKNEILKSEILNEKGNSNENQNNIFKLSKSRNYLVPVIIIYILCFIYLKNLVEETVDSIIVENKYIVNIDSVTIPLYAPLSSDYFAAVTVSNDTKQNIVNFRVDGYFWDRIQVSVSGIELMKVKLLAGKNILGD